jgi:hypothetical protein
MKISVSGKTVMLPVADSEKQTQIIHFVVPIDGRTRVGRSTSTPFDCPETARTLSIEIIYHPKKFGNREVLWAQKVQQVYVSTDM